MTGSAYPSPDMLPEEEAGNNSRAKSMEDGNKGKVLLPDKVMDGLKKAARKAAGNSYSPYSGFCVGAAVIAKNGKIYAGTNVENSSYGLTLCAERSAVSAAVSAGEMRIEALAIYTPTDESQPPCGACLQVISEFADGDIPIFMFSQEKERWSTLDQLLPLRFKLKAKEK
jgi:cytidine deaminase